MLFSLKIAWPDCRKYVQSDLCLERHRPAWVDWPLPNPLKESRTSEYLENSAIIINIYPLAILQTPYLPYMMICRVKASTRAFWDVPRLHWQKQKHIRILPTGPSDFGITAEETWLTKLLKSLWKYNFYYAHFIVTEIKISLFLQHYFHIYMFNFSGEQKHFFSRRKVFCFSKPLQERKTHLNKCMASGSAGQFLAHEGVSSL